MIRPKSYEQIEEACLILTRVYDTIDADPDGFPGKHLLMLGVQAEAQRWAPGYESEAEEPIRILRAKLAEGGCGEFTPAQRASILEQGR